MDGPWMHQIWSEINYKINFYLKYTLEQLKLHEDVTNKTSFWETLSYVRQCFEFCATGLLIPLKNK